MIESNKKHELLFLLGLTNFKQQSSVKNQSSSKEEWQKEARRLEMQGKQEQADAIRSQILQVQPVPWEVTTRKRLSELVSQALNPDSFNKKAKDRLFEYALYYGDRNYFNQLVKLKYRPAERWEQEGKSILKRIVSEYEQDNVKALQPKLQKYGIDFRNEVNLTPLMLALSHGADKVADYLIENGARINLTDNFGRNSLQLLILKSYLNANYKQKFNRFYGFLKGESLRVKIDNRLIKLDHHQAEFLMLNYMISVMRIHFIQRLGKPIYVSSSRRSLCFQTSDFANFFQGLNTAVVPDYRCKRPYLSSILAKNEVNKEDKYNKKLFVRLQNGMYLPNPLMELLVDDEWINIYDLINIDEIEKNYAHFGIGTGPINQIKNYRQQLIENPDVKIDAEKYWKSLYEGVSA